MISQPDNIFDTIVNVTQPLLGPIPTDGVLLSLACWFLSPPETRLRNTIIVGGIHYLFHHSVEKFDHPSNNNNNPPVLNRSLPEPIGLNDKLF